MADCYDTVGAVSRDVDEEETRAKQPRAEYDGVVAYLV
jgi:hypothetical protein